MIILILHRLNLIISFLYYSVTFDHCFMLSKEKEGLMYHLMRIYLNNDLVCLNTSIIDSFWYKNNY